MWKCASNKQKQQPFREVTRDIINRHYTSLSNNDTNKICLRLSVNVGCFLIFLVGSSALGTGQVFSSTADIDGRKGVAIETEISVIGIVWRQVTGCCSDSVNAMNIFHTVSLPCVQALDQKQLQKKLINWHVSSSTQPASLHVTFRQCTVQK